MEREQRTLISGFSAWNRLYIHCSWSSIGAAGRHSYLRVNGWWRSRNPESPAAGCIRRWTGASSASVSTNQIIAMTTTQNKPIKPRLLWICESFLFVESGIRLSGSSETRRSVARSCNKKRLVIMGICKITIDSMKQ